MRFDVVVNSPAAAHGPDWAVILPVKPLVAAKSRLSPDDGATVQDLAMAFFQDTATAALACRHVARVLVATRDARVTEWALASGCEVVDDSAARGINAAATLAALRVPSGESIAVLVGDLPCLTPAALERVLAAALQRPTAFLADADGTGTTTWMSEQPFNSPRCGPGSRAAHVACGAWDLAAELDDPLWISARRDIDTAADLAAARAIGLGSHTAAALQRRDSALT